MKTLALCAAFISLFFAASASAQKSTIEGNAADANGRPLKNAQVRIEQENAKRAAVMTKTDTKGHFVAAGLPVGSYKVAVVVGGETKWSAAHVKTSANQVVRLNLSGKQVAVQTAATAPAQPKRRANWVPSQTGTHMGGHYEDEPYRGPGADNVEGMSGAAMQRIQSTYQARPATGGQ